MLKKSLFILLVGLLASTITIAQKNRISIYSGLFHNYFDGSPMLNVNYHSDEWGFFKNRFFSSFGIAYQRKLNSKSSIYIDVDYRTNEWKHIFPNLETNAVQARENVTANLGYKRNFMLSKKFNFIYGGGINFRRGHESILVSYGKFIGTDFYHSNSVSRNVNDFGLNIRTGIEYTPVKWLTLYSKFNLIGFFFLDDRETIDLLQRDYEGYGYSEYPHRFDLSWRFGVGFNF
ncbi:hypothetical protein CW751_09540 [Brumimicrobium salinarum]|uniref:Outer membrane protein beta-barrel domain-containing protein n=2 Tax=Brumimicrobium salinarum TaxID=2058658 RepID=A0A2I0R208_9FLAO|nr:hypothetical protein CW751_09540 [Brumimicrobium salinarum]